MQQIYDLIIIGGGPGGIGAAVESKILGLEKVLLIEKGDNHSQTIRKFYKDNKRVDKDYKGQVIELAGNVDFKDGTKESTLNYFDSLLDNEEIDTAFNSEVEKIKKDAENILNEYSKNNITIDYITGGLDEYPITGRKAVDILKEINPDIVVVSGVPHALPIEELKEINKDVITVGISDGPRLYHPIKEVYDYGIIELDAHAKVLGKRNIVKSRFGEVLRYALNK